jgi:hypothetical protein
MTQPLRPQRLSSRLTSTFQVAPVGLWLAVVYVFVWVAARHEAPAPTLRWVVLLILVPPLLLLPVVAAWAARLRTVATDGNNLLVTLVSRQVAEVPLTSVIHVREWRELDVRTVRVTFDRRTRAGRSVRFLAPTRFVVRPGEAHPVVLALRGTVDVAQSQTTLAIEPPAKRPMLRAEPVPVSG